MRDVFDISLRARIHNRAFRALKLPRGLKTYLSLQAVLPSHKKTKKKHFAFLFSSKQENPLGGK